MSQTPPSEVSLQAPPIPGVEIVERIRRLFVVGLLAALGYSTFMHASKGGCGSRDGIETCVTLTLRPSGLILIAIAAIALAALTMVLRRAAGIPSAIRYLDRAAVIIALLAAASVIISQVWFQLMPITDWYETGRLVYPFPFGSVDLEIEPS